MKNLSHIVFPRLLVILAAAVAGCRSTEVNLPAEPGAWKAEPPSCVKVAESQIIVGPGRIVAENFTWANSEIQFKLFDPSGASFTIAFYDASFAKLREANAGRWFRVVDGKRVPLSKTADSWRIDMVHALTLGGDQNLSSKGFRAFGGSVTTEIGSQGLPVNPPVVVLAENFKISEWNEVRIEVKEGLITVWLNGVMGQSVQTDRRLNGTFGFEVERGELKISNLRLERL